MNSIDNKRLNEIVAKAHEEFGSSSKIIRNPDITDAGEQLKIWASSLKYEDQIEWLRKQVNAAPWQYHTRTERDCDLRVKPTAFTPMPRGFKPGAKSETEVVKKAEAKSTPKVAAMVF